MLAFIAVVLGAAIGSNSLKAQTLPGDGNCWACIIVGGNGGGDNLTCIGVSSGAYECHLYEVSTQFNICVTEGTGCTTGLFAANGDLREIVPCAALLEVEATPWIVAAGIFRELSISERLDATLSKLVTKGFPFMNAT